MDVAQFVSTFPTLQLTPEEALPLVSQLSELPVPAGGPVIPYGEENASIFFIAEGCLEISLGGGIDTLHIGQVGRGHWIGELGLIAPDVAIAEVRAVEASRLYRLSNWQFQELAYNHPKTASVLLHTISLQLSERLRKAGAVRTDFHADAAMGAGEEKSAWLSRLGRWLMGVGEDGK